jgi:hypothetical protein
LSGWPSVTHSEVNKKRSLNVKTPPIAGNSIWAVWSEDRFTLDHRHKRRIFSRIGPTLAQHMPAPSGLSLGMHCSMVIAASVRGQSLAANGEQRHVSRDFSALNCVPFNSPDCSSPD